MKRACANVCVGETLEQREKGSVEKILSLQLRGSLADLTARELRENRDCLRPVWAIGTGRNARRNRRRKRIRSFATLCKNCPMRRRLSISEFNTAEV